MSYPETTDWEKVEGICALCWKWEKSKKGLVCCNRYICSECKPKHTCIASRFRNAWRKCRNFGRMLIGRKALD